MCFECVTSVLRVCYGWVKSGLQVGDKGATIGLQVDYKWILSGL